MNYWLQMAKLTFWLGLIFNVLATKLFTAFVNGLLGSNIPSGNDLPGLWLFAVSAAASLIHIAEGKK